VGAFGHQYGFQLSGTDRAGFSSPINETGTTVADTCLKDAYEDGAGDNNQANAIPILVGTSQTHNFCGIGDNDWVSFVAAAGKTYIIIARPTYGSAAAPVLNLYSNDGVHINGVQQVNPTGLSQSGLIVWTTPTSGTYTLNAQSVDPTVAGTGVSYTLTVAENNIFLPRVNSIPINQ
jgi:hypothetical protein